MGGLGRNRRLDHNKVLDGNAVSWMYAPKILSTYVVTQATSRAYWKVVVLRSTLPLEHPPVRLTEREAARRVAKTGNETKGT